MTNFYSIASSATQGAARLGYGLIKSPLIAAKTAYQHPKSTVATILTIGSLATFAYLYPQELQKHLNPVLTSISNSAEKGLTFVQDALAHYNLLDYRTENKEVCFKNYLFTTCHRVEVPVNIFFKFKAE